MTDPKQLEAQAVAKAKSTWAKWRLPIIAFLVGLLAGIGVSHAAAPAPLSATLNWTAPTMNTDGTTITLPLTYNLYQGTMGSTGKPQILSGGTSLTATVTAGLAPGTTVCWEVTATAGGQESAHSNEACKTFPASTPAAPTLTVQ